MYKDFIDFDGIFNLAIKETEELIKLGFDISDPYIITPLGWYANKYPEIVEHCNKALLEFIDKQAASLCAGHSKIDLDSF
ncbi:hypothetical protein [Anabaena sp. PCC 7108]|uniref:hypothetical protein n=1 Tax=Anabaena sp. PCC 7108 TaxID=163908 RepID=UPI00034C29DD|nr:hypothetical protein [Anabaena sp. PCC 7108]